LNRIHHAGKLGKQVMPVRVHTRHGAGNDGLHHAFKGIKRADGPFLVLTMRRL